MYIYIYLQVKVAPMATIFCALSPLFLSLPVSLSLFFSVSLSAYMHISLSGLFLSLSYTLSLHALSGLPYTFIFLFIRSSTCILDLSIPSYNWPIFVTARRGVGLWLLLCLPARLSVVCLLICQLTVTVRASVCVSVCCLHRWSRCSYDEHRHLIQNSSGTWRLY